MTASKKLKTLEQRSADSWHNAGNARQAVMDALPQIVWVVEAAERMPEPRNSTWGALSHKALRDALANLDTALRVPELLA